ncbi:hypothetical protein NCCP1664_11630 [Zafaria cholistanensis]|uniref:Signal peptidase I n=1 Tax=Zafaria cholistanensis TaxID=1682741 RepID=A0A5A7NQ40_9MICC|nr:signal peptidase I [Zafaria cholistanensis]GER22666.1 hypothetical protein NCCP1664_11630 [Zafaria cholistanensis]
MSTVGRTSAGERRRLPLWLATLVNVVVAVAVVALVQMFLVKVYSVPSGSMETTLNVGDRILVNRLAYGAGAPPRGEIVVFGADAAWEQEFLATEQDAAEQVLRGFGDLTGIGPSNEKFLVKRVIGIPGDTVECCSPEGAVMVNGQALAEDYLHEDFDFVPGTLDCASTPVSFRCFGPVGVPEDKVLVLGDHRSTSSDSVATCRGRDRQAQVSCARFVSTADVVGKVVVKAWPPSDWRAF